MAALQYKLQPQWKMGKKIQAAAYNGAHTVYGFRNQMLYWDIIDRPHGSYSVVCAYVSSVEDEKTKETMDILWVGWCSTVQQSGVALSSNQ